MTPVARASSRAVTCSRDGLAGSPAWGRPTKNPLLRPIAHYSDFMDFRDPFAVVTPTLDGPVLRVLTRAATPLTTQQVIDLSDEGSPNGVRKVLRRLVDQGVVIESRVGKTYTYEANREHLAWPAIQKLANLAQQLDDAIREKVAGWAIQPLSVELFGSVARGDAETTSDVDILVAAPNLTDDQLDPWAEQLADLQDSVARWTGNSVDVLDLAPHELVELATEEAPALTGRRHRIAGTPTSDLVPKHFLETLRELNLAQNPSMRLTMTPALTQMLTELQASVSTDLLSDSLRNALANMTPILSDQARAALTNTARRP